MADPRTTAARNVVAVLQGRSLDSVLSETAAALEPRDRALAAELSYGVCRWYRRLDALVARRLQRPLKSKDRDLQALLLVGAYQLLYSRVPAHAAISSTVEASRALGKGWASKLVNGVLRGLQRDHQALAAAVDVDPAVRHAQPDWLYEALADAWPEQLGAILDALQARPPMTLRVDLVQSGRDEYAQELAATGLSGRPHPQVPSALVLDEPTSVDRLPGFGAGRVSVQDAGAQLAAPFLDLQPGQSVLDACAAPGGKTLHLLQHAADLQLTALDIDKQRLDRVAENLQRAGRHAELRVGDAAQPDNTPWGRRIYERILVDAPCSAVGVMRRHPDIRLLRRAADVPALVARQARILDALWELLRPGGRMLYVTCSLLPVENADQIEGFCARHGDARAVELPLGPGSRSGKGVQLLPGIDDTDGFYYAALIKASGA